MWTCNGDLKSDCCSTFETPDASVDNDGNVVFTCPFCGSIAEPSDADGAAMLRDIVDMLINR